MPGQAERTVVMMEFLEKAWQRPDDGIWEVRGGRRHFTHSKLMAWVAVDRAIRAQEKWKFGGPAADQRLPHWRALRSRIREDILANGYNPRVGAFTQYYGGDTLDASVLVMAHVGFLPATDPRMQGTVKAIERHLLRDGYVLRYSTEGGVDGLPGSEAAFLACSFWLADNYALAGRLEEAEALFDKLLSIRNHLGLLAEEYDPVGRRQLGNFPQAFSHLAQIFTAALILVSGAARSRRAGLRAGRRGRPRRLPERVNERRRQGRAERAGSGEAGWKRTWRAERAFRQGEGSARGSCRRSWPARPSSRASARTWWRTWPRRATWSTSAETSRCSAPTSPTTASTWWCTEGCASSARMPTAIGASSRSPTGAIASACWGSCPG
ncbi:MAG: glycoside hydrolase family 15 protein [Myxococcales bacterium]